MKFFNFYLLLMEKILDEIKKEIQLNYIFYDTNMYNIIFDYDPESLLKPLLANKYSEEDLDNAIISGDLLTVKYCDKILSECFTIHTMDSAAKYGRLEVVKWLSKNREEGCTVNAMDMAATYGHLEIVKWLLENVINVIN